MFSTKGNTTICCESPHDSEVPNILQHLGLQNSSNNNIANVPSPILPIVPVPWRPPNQVSTSNSSRPNGKLCCVYLFIQSHKIFFTYFSSC